MFRRTPKDFLKDNLFLVVTIFFATVASFGLYYVTSSLSAKIAPKRTEPKVEESTKFGGEKFVVTCFNDSLGMRCKSKKTNGHCSDDFRKRLQAICTDMEAVDILPLDKIVVDIRRYDGCDEKLEKQAGCMPHFIREGYVNGYGAGFIYLPAFLFEDKESLRIVLIHELTHALTSKYQTAMTRIVKEFFAIYTQIQFYGFDFNKTCNGEEWNQPALRNYGGEYLFPPQKKYRAMSALSICRYGQLEYIVRLIHRQSPFLFNALWNELTKNKDSVLDATWLKKKIAEIDSKTGEIISRFHILKEADASPQLAIVGDTYEYCSFIYKNVSASEEYYSEKSGFQMEWLRDGKRVDWTALSYAPLFCYPATGFLSGDILHVRAVGFGKSFHRIFIVP